MGKNKTFFLQNFCLFFFITIFVVLKINTPIAYAYWNGLPLEETGATTNATCIEHAYNFATGDIPHITIPTGWSGMCLPGKYYNKACGNDGICKPEQNCAVVSSAADAKKYAMMCVNMNETVYGEKEITLWKNFWANGGVVTLTGVGAPLALPLVLNAMTQENFNKALSTSGCNNNTDCKPNEQCSWVTTVSDAPTDGVLNTIKFFTDISFNQRAAATRCLPIERLPPEAAQKKLCNTYQTVCPHGDDDICVDNPYSPEWFHYSCYEKKYVIPGDCQKSSLAQKCGDKGLCVKQVKYHEPDKYVCIDTEHLPGGSNAPSDHLCQNDSQCEKDSPYCLVNPVTEKQQCFSQKNIYTDLGINIFGITYDPNATKCFKDSAGTDAFGCTCPKDKLKACAPDPNKENSICTQHILSSTLLEFVCIKTKALGEGAADVVIPSAKTAPERTTRPTPKLEIDVPGLEFSGNVTGEPAEGGHTFALPYIAQYINAVYRYAIGLGIVLAVVMLMYAGIRWMTSLGDSSQVSDAQSMVQNAVLGLILLMSVYTILYIINPDLIKLKSLQILAPTQATWDLDTGISDASDGDKFTGAAVSISAGSFPDYKQCDSRWADTPYTDKSNNPMQCTSSHNSPPGSEAPDTICKSGCGITSLANVLAYYGEQVSPKEAAAFSAKIGAHTSCVGTAGPSLCKSIAGAYPKLQCHLIKTGDTKAVIDNVRAKKPVIFSCHGCEGTTNTNAKRSYKAHYMILIGINADGTQFQVLDSARKNDYVVSINADQLNGKMTNMYVIEKK